jgi:two-component system OmpR family sensor kinase
VIERLRATGLRTRLAVTIAAIIVAAAGATFIAVYRGTGAQIRSQIERDLSNEATSLEAHLAGAPDRARAILRHARRSIAAAPAFGPSSRLLVVDVPGAGLATNEPELFGLRQRGGDETPADRRRERGEAAAIRSAPAGYSTVSLEDAGTVQLLKHPQAGPEGAATVTVGEPLAPVDRAQDGVARTFLIAGSLTLLVALAAAVGVAAWTAAPLRRMASTAGAVDAGDLTHRMDEHGPREVQSLAESFNHMLDRLDEAFARQRAFASDASHELRTPLTAIRGQIEVLARSASPSRGDIEETEARIAAEISRMDRLVDDLLLLARSDEGSAHRVESINATRLIHESVEGVAAGDREVRIGAVPAGTLQGDPDRLAQVIRNLVRNAVEHTGERGVVDVSGFAVDGHLRVTVDDDGPGIPESERKLVFERFHRTDASRGRRSGGSGLGLAIARAIVDAHGGRIWIAESPAGGARVTFDVPGFSADAA